MSLSYSIIENVKKEDLLRYSYADEEWKQVLASPYLISNHKRIWYNNTIYYGISLDDFFDYVLHGDDDSGS